MLRTLIVAALAAAAVPTSPALADHAFFDCQRTDTAIVGYVVAPGDTVSIRCDVRLAGAVIASTPTASGPHAAVTWGPSVAAPGSFLCAAVTAGAESWYVCFSH